MRRATGQLLIVAPLLMAATADVSRYRAPATADGLLGVGATDPLAPLELTLGTMLGYADNPVVWRYADGSYDPVVRRQLVLDVVGAVGVMPFVDLAVALPILLDQRGPRRAGLGDLRGGGIGDVRIMPRLQLADERSFGYGSALIVELTVPTGDDERFVGERSVSVRPRVVASLTSGRAQLITSLGYNLRKNASIADVQLGDEIDLHAGGELGVLDGDIPVAALMELSAVTQAADPFAESAFALELLAGARARVSSDLLVTAGAGAGLTRGVGTPAFRLLLGVSYAPLREDADRDGTADHRDACPYEPEDRDRFEDGDGCPDWDNDKDGAPDEADDCPNEPEDINSYLDDDGCPDADEVDTDNDGITDINDACPKQAEDKDDHQDDDGCPDFDNDGDGVADELDKCPNEDETINGKDDWDGCPDAGEGDTKLTSQQIEIKQTVLFESGKAIIKEQSLPLLDQVALQILANDDIAKVRIEGHTDSYGPEEDNLYLSQDRADAVRRYLVKRGVAKDMLEATGYGETRPIDTNDNATGRARNRRVEFFITNK